MDSANILLDYTLSLPPCIEGNTNFTQECIEQEKEPEWLENEVAGIRIWQLVGIILLIILAITIMICCCIRFRVPRTKQEIEADYIRKKLTRSFRKELAKINDREMDEMDLRIALDRVREVFRTTEIHDSQSQETIIYKKTNPGFITRFNACFHSIRAWIKKDDSTEFSAMI